MNNEEKGFFEQAMADVTPLSGRQQTLYLKADHREDQRARRAAQALQQENPLSSDLLEIIPCDVPLEYRGEGIQQGVLEKLRHGRYAPQASLNLLKRPVESCRQELFRFIVLAQQENLRSLLVVHGRGREDESHANIVRSYLAKWLAQLEPVQAFCRALPRDGGDGACYVTLRKSAQAKADNFERHAKRSR
ncbi:DNA endonuclease SmrA [Serratia odorifera]|jgi:DNA-nicking Smr family endonuclease|uniref:Smr domain protein n=2 Tax=Serratia odorifera TaxID=618 RepID=D4E2L5_SEROD|nr:DNA endonuclease SmrA [Serratia odorifera]EFE95977.1 Smr domain protein [Serratia odorifera DSM 4582]MBJ2067477.1 DNA endonuclease SmrA [Serratia odorifera]PNK90580.1 DNA endonuclease SmrA [Serratia odorifera]RII71671.1 DNA endonuclease SmrA [Serratia odorifera]VDZ59005.1 Probable DNA endonuclease SmrA [Serratia odorifera]